LSGKTGLALDSSASSVPKHQRGQLAGGAGRQHVVVADQSGWVDGMGVEVLKGGNSVSVSGGVRNGVVRVVVLRSGRL
jgi:hypothetical protein